MTSSRPSGDRTLTWWPFVGAAIIAAIGIGVIVLVGSGTQNRDGLATDDNGALTCPTTYLQNALDVATVPRAWVPVKGTGVDGTSALVPDSKPQDVTICHYGSAGTLGQARPALLGQGVTLTQGQQAMAKALSAYPAAADAQRRCTTAGDYYLAGFVFGGGAIWVAVPDDGCQNVTNGDFEVSADIRPQIVSAYQTRHWG